MEQEEILLKYDTLPKKNEIMIDIYNHYQSVGLNGQTIQELTELTNEVYQKMDRISYLNFSKNHYDKKSPLEYVLKIHVPDKKFEKLGIKQNKL